MKTNSFLLLFITFIFQASISQGIVPSEWKKANVVPVYKEGSRTNPGNYRPISLTNSCCKILEHIIYSSIFSHLDKYNVLCENQHGFRSNCESQLRGVVNDFSKALDAGEQVDALFIDFAIAFDKVPHERLCQKLLHYSITGKLLHWIKNFLFNRSQVVVVNRYCSDPCPVLSGVPQGTVLAHLLFLLFIMTLHKISTVPLGSMQMTS